MVRYKRIFLNFLIFVTFSIPFLAWSYFSFGWVKFSIGIFLLSIAILHFIKEVYYKRELDQWLSANNGKIILYYLSKKKLQDKIKEEIIPKIEFPIFQVYYDGPKISGDLKPMHVIEMMNNNSNIKPHSPAILIVRKLDIEVIPLQELNQMPWNQEAINIVLYGINQLKYKS